MNPVSQRSLDMVAAAGLGIGIVAHEHYQGVRDLDSSRRVFRSHSFYCHGGKDFLGRTTAADDEAASVLWLSVSRRYLGRLDLISGQKGRRRKTGLGNLSGPARLCSNLSEATKESTQ
jgi:hypothetical protein